MVMREREREAEKGDSYRAYEQITWKIENNHFSCSEVRERKKKSFSTTKTVFLFHTRKPFFITDEKKVHFYTQEKIEDM